MIKKEGEKKICSHCRQPLDDDKFYKDNSKEDKLSNECKECSLERRRSNYSVRLEETIIKIKYACEEINSKIQAGEFLIGDATLAIDNLVGSKIKITIPITRQIKIVYAEFILKMALDYITTLSDITGEVKIVNKRPFLVITGIVKDSANKTI